MAPDRARAGGRRRGGRSGRGAHHRPGFHGRRDAGPRGSAGAHGDAPGSVSRRHRAHVRCPARPPANVRWCWTVPPWIGRLWIGDERRPPGRSARPAARATTRWVRSNRPSIVGSSSKRESRADAAALAAHPDDAELARLAHPRLSPFARWPRLSVLVAAIVVKASLGGAPAPAPATVASDVPVVSVRAPPRRPRWPRTPPRARMTPSRPP